MIEEIGKKIKVVIEEGSNSKSLFGILIFEDDYCIKLELIDGTIFTINKDKIISTREYKEESSNYG